MVSRNPGYVLLMADPEQKSQADPKIYVRLLLLQHLLTFHRQSKSLEIRNYTPPAVGGHNKVTRQMYEGISLLHRNEELGPILEFIARSMRAAFKCGSNELLKEKKLAAIGNLCKECCVQSCSWQQCKEWIGEKTKNTRGDYKTLL